MDRIIEAVREAGKIILEAGTDFSVEEKSSPRDLVTSYDKKVQEFLYSRLSEAFPGAAFLGEEDLKEEGHGNGLFIIDPIDGTTNFIKGLRDSVISVAYAAEGKLKYGVVYNPYYDEMFSAQSGCGAFLNGTSIHASSDDLEHSLVLFGSTPYDPEKWDFNFSSARKLMGKCIDVRRLGAAAYDCVLVAGGKAGVFYEAKLRPWDYAAGILIGAEAGAIISDIDGNPIDDYTKTIGIVIAGQNCYEKFMKLIK